MALVPWLGKGNRLDLHDPDSRDAVEDWLGSPNTVALLEVGSTPFGLFLEQRRADLTRHKKLTGDAACPHHTLVAQANPPAGLRLWDPWSGPSGQPFEVAWSQLWEDPTLYLVGALVLEPGWLRAPSAPEDRV